MQITINQRIEAIVRYSGLSLTAFSRKIGIAQTSLRDCVKGGSEPKFTTLEKIIIAEPLISPEWLLTGKGSMLKEEASTSSNSTANNGGVAVSGQNTGNIYGGNSISISLPESGNVKIIKPDGTVETHRADSNVFDSNEVDKLNSELEYLQRELSRYKDELIKSKDELICLYKKFADHGE